MAPRSSGHHATSIHLVMRASRFEQDGLFLTLSDELENNPQVIAVGTCPRRSQISFQLMAPQRRMQRVLFQQVHRRSQVLRCLRISSRQSPRRAQKWLRRQQNSLHDLISLAMATALAGLTRPPANSARATRTAATNSSRRRSAIRWRNVAANCSCSSSESLSAASSVLAYVVRAGTSPTPRPISTLHSLQTASVSIRVHPWLTFRLSVRP